MILSAIAGIVVSFFHPTQLHGQHYLLYEGTLIDGSFLIVVLGYWIYRLQKP